MKAEFLSKREAARYIGRSVSWLEKKEKEGEICHVYTTNNRRFYAASDLETLAINFGKIEDNPNYKPNVRIDRNQVKCRTFLKLSSQS